MNLRDPDNNKGMKVNQLGEGLVRATIDLEFEKVVQIGGAFAWDSGELDIVAGGTMLFLQNNGDALLWIDRVRINGSDVVCTWEIGIGIDTDTPVGTPVPPVNQFPTFASSASDILALSNETAIADQPIIERVKTEIDESTDIRPRVLLGKGQSIQIRQVTESIRGSVLLHCHFKPETS